MNMREEIERLEEEILIGELGDDLFYVSGRGRVLRDKLKAVRDSVKS